MGEQAKEQYAIECRKITKTFGKVVANDEIDLKVRYGEILALLGENGSGKTTLMNMLSGIYHPDSGQIFIGGKEVKINSPADSMKLGIGMIHQHFKLVEAFQAMDNIILGTAGKKEKSRVTSEKIKTISENYGLEIEPEKYVCDMSVSEKQTVEILKVLYKGAEILILDEPTAGFNAAGNGKTVPYPEKNERKRLCDYYYHTQASGSFKHQRQGDHSPEGKKHRHGSDSRVRRQKADGTDGGTSRQP